MSNHTKGKWGWDFNIIDGHRIICDHNEVADKQRIIALIEYDEDIEPEQEELEANTRLISKAPDMWELLGELKQLLGNIGLYSPGIGGTTVSIMYGDISILQSIDKTCKQLLTEIEGNNENE